jgi:hypothetical protein
LTDLQPVPQNDTLLQLRQLTQKIDKAHPTPADLQTIRDFLAEHPDLWEAIGNMAQHAANNLINRTNANPLVAESLKQYVRHLKADLNAHTASPLERILVEQVAMSWLRLNFIELAYNEQLSQSPDAPTLDHWDKRLSAAQRRFLQACQTLARISKLTRTTPPLQINIAAPGGQQINILNQTSPPDGLSPPENQE